MTLLEAVQTVARLAGARALSHFRQGVQVETKADGSPVTVGDREAEQVARAWIAEHFPEDGIVGEEGADVRPGASRRWLIDPIDGTKAFVRGVPLWGTLIAVAQGESVLAGAVSLPALDELVAAERGAGCFWNGRRCHVSGVEALSRATVLTTDAGALSRRLRPVLEAGAVSRTWGDCYGYVLVATGRAEAMIDPVLADWDSAALQPIVEEAGGVFTSLSGARTGFGRSAIATNLALADPIRRLIAPGSGARGELTLPKVDFSKGLVPVIAQDATTGGVLMMAWTDEEALRLSVETREMHYRSRTRGLWRKGATSGNVQHLESLSVDCDGDTLLARVVPAGPACHTGAVTCFGAATGDELSALMETVRARAREPSAGSYTSKLLVDRNLRLKKLGEETAELVLALADGDPQRSSEEAADLMYHLLVALEAAGLGLDDVRRVLRARAR